MKRPMLSAAIIFILCILIYRFMGIGFFVAGILLFFGILCFVNKSILHIVLFGLLLSSLVFSVFLLNEKISVSKKLSGKEFTGNFIVISEPEVKKNLCVKALSYDNGLINDRMKFYLYFNEGGFTVGEKITVKANAIKIEDEQGFNELFYSNSYGRLWLKDTVSHNGYDKFYYAIGRVRGFVKEYFSKKLSYDSFATIIAIIIGDKSALSDELYANVKNSGVSHIMAVSGLHLSVIMGMLFLFVNRLVKIRYIRFIIIVFMLIFISAICGFTPSVIRASVMLGFLAIPQLFKRDTDKLSVLCLSIVMLLIAEPYLVFNVSFQMSVSAVFAVMLAVPVYCEEIKKRLHVNNRFVSGTLEIVVISLFAQIFTAPFSVYKYGMISIAAPLTNVFISFAVGIVLQLGFISLVISFLPVFSGYLLFVAEGFISYINFVITKIGGLKYSALDVPEFVCIIPAAIEILLIVGMYFIDRRKKFDVRCDT